MPLPPHTFSLKLLLGLVTILAVAMALCGVGWRMNSGGGAAVFGSGLIAAVFGTPALALTSYSLREHSEKGDRLPVYEQIGLFLSALCFMFVATLSGMVAFVIVSVPVGVAFGVATSALGAIVGLIIGLFAAGFVGWHVLWSLWND